MNLKERAKSQGPKAIKRPASRPWLRRDYFYAPDAYSTRTLKQQIIELGRLAGKDKLEQEALRNLLALVTASYLQAELENRFEDVLFNKISGRLKRLFSPA